MQDVTEPTPFPALRLIFEYTGTEVRLVSQQPVDLAVTGHDLHQDVRAGHFVEVRDGADRPLSRVAAHSAFADSAEVFPEDHSEPITRVDTPGARGAFTVVVPAPAEADHVALIRVTAPPADQRTMSARATDTDPGEPQISELAVFAIERGR